MPRQISQAAILATFLAVGIALPALGQDTGKPAVSPLPSPSVTQPAPSGSVIVSPSATRMMLTTPEAAAWVDKPVYSSDGKKIGEVAAFQRSPDNTVTEMHADIGGFLGMGETRVKLVPTQFKLQGDRVVLDVTAAQAKDLPIIKK
jgi:PRC-barrel domain